MVVEATSLAGGVYMEHEQEPLEIYSLWRHRELHYRVQVIALATISGVRTVTVQRLDARDKAVCQETILVATLRLEYWQETCPSEVAEILGEGKKGAA